VDQGEEKGEKTMPYRRTGSTTVFYRDEGEGPPVVLVHGNAASHRWWDQVVSPLAASHRVLAPDLPGFGRSDPPDTYTVEAQARILAEWATAVDVGRAHWVGHSLGGAIVLQLALDAPQLVRSLVLIDSAPATGMPLTDEGLQALQEGIHDRSVVRERLAVISPAADHGAWFEELVDEALRAHGWVPMAVALTTWNVEARLPAIDVPALVVHGADDILVPPAWCKPMAHRLPRARWHLVSGVGHCLPLERPAALADMLLEFFGTAGDPPAASGRP
jgi:pimeloyl-ACP methyl ester carboxylesterase